MKNVLKIIILALFYIFFSYSIRLEAGELHAEVRNDAGNGIEFPGINNLDVRRNLWIVSPQYIYVSYSCDPALWGVRIITNNSQDIGGVYPKPLATGPDNDNNGELDDIQWEWERLGNDGYLPDPEEPSGWATGNDIVTYSGLINDSTKMNPNCRAPLAWQVFMLDDPYRDRYVEQYRVLEGQLFPNPGPLNDNTVGGELYDDWAYIADESDTGYVNDPTHEYFLVAFGYGNFSQLAWHPVVTLSDRDDDQNGVPDALPKAGGNEQEHEMVIYLGAHFGMKAPNGVDDVSILPAGRYRTRVYIELINL